MPGGGGLADAVGGGSTTRGTDRQPSAGVVGLDEDVGGPWPGLGTALIVVGGMLLSGARRFASWRPGRTDRWRPPG